ncbi:MAG: hypothetical protein U9Q07_15460, partial [Planctomycetota bacterium]|nr:hypothetical protein [Planctomycetota bacterium]
METTKRIVILLILGLLAVGPGQSAEKPAKKISNTRTASCLVKITCDPAILPLNLETIDYLLRSSGVGGKAARETLEFPTDEVHDLFTIEYLQLSASEGDARSSKGMSKAEDNESEMDEYEYAMMMEMEMGMGGEEYYLPGAVRPKYSSAGRRSRYGATRTRRTAPTPARAPSTTSSVNGQTYLCSLNIDLPDEVKPAAKEFMNALVDNSRQTLIAAYNTYGKNLGDLLQFAEHQRSQAQTQLAKAMEQVEAIKVTPRIGLNPTDAAVHEQLEQIVDLSKLNAGMCFEEVVTELEHSIDPPLQIQPNWKDLLEMAEIEPTTPAMVDS